MTVLMLTLHFRNLNRISNSLLKQLWSNMNTMFSFKRKKSQAAIGSLLSSVFCCRAGSGYANGYPVLGNSQGGFPLPSLQFVITYCDQSFPSPWHCLSVAPSRCYPLVHSRGHSPIRNLGTWPAGGRRSAPAVCQSLTSATPPR